MCEVVLNAKQAHGIIQTEMATHAPPLSTLDFLVSVDKNQNKTIQTMRTDACTVNIYRAVYVILDNLVHLVFVFLTL